MTISTNCPSRLCTIVLSGKITSESPELLAERLKDTSDIENILLESPGGNLTAGMELGRIIRNSGLGTQIGGFPWRQEESEFADLCASACAYAFLGGSVREVAGDGKLGFHGFFLSEKSDQLILANQVLGKAQAIASDIVLYVVEMGVDARIFADASIIASGDMLFPTAETMLQYSITTPERYSHFSIDPYKNGIVAFSKKLIPLQVYDENKQLTAYCKDGTPYLLYTSRLDGLPIAGLSIYLKEESDDAISIDKSNVQVVGNDGGASIKVRITRKIADKIQSSKYFYSSYNLAPAEGGEHQFELRLNAQDRKFLKAAFRLCI